MVSSPKRPPKNKARRCWCLQVLFLMTKLNILPRQLLLNPDTLVTCVVLPDVGFFLPRSFVCSPAFGVRSFEWKPRAKDPWWAVDHFILDATRCGMCRAHFLEGVCTFIFSQLSDMCMQSYKAKYYHIKVTRDHCSISTAISSSSKPEVWGWRSAAPSWLIWCGCPLMLPPWVITWNFHLLSDFLTVAGIFCH